MSFQVANRGCRRPTGGGRGLRHIMWCRVSGDIGVVVV